MAPTDKDLGVRKILYQEAQSNGRALIDLRFKHFATFTVMLGLIGALAYKVADLNQFRHLVLLGGALITALFWALDARTAALHREELAKAFEFEAEFSPRRQVAPYAMLSAGSVTNLIFATIFLGWALLMVFSFPALL